MDRVPRVRRVGPLQFCAGKKRAVAFREMNSTGETAPPFACRFRADGFGNLTDGFVANLLAHAVAHENRDGIS